MNKRKKKKANYNSILVKKYINCYSQISNIKVKLLSYLWLYNLRISNLDCRTQQLKNWFEENIDGKGDPLVNKNEEISFLKECKSVIAHILSTSATKQKSPGVLLPLGMVESPTVTKLCQSVNHFIGMCKDF